MGKWAKSHVKPRKMMSLKPWETAKGLTKDLKDDVTPDMPGAPDEETALRNRQAIELAKLDEEENRRIKSMFAGGGGRKMFRSARSAISKAASAAGGGSASGGYSGGSSSGGGGYGGARARGTSVLP